MSNDDAENRRVSQPKTDQLRALLEPTGTPQLERLSDYIRRYGARYVFDSRVILFDVRGRVEDGKAVLDGRVGIPGLKSGLVQSLMALEFAVEADGVDVAPNPDALTERYALVSSSSSFLYRSPNLNTDPTDQVLIGSPLILMVPPVDGFHLIRNSVGYLGWIYERDICFVDRETWRFWFRDERYLFESETKLGSFTIPAGSELPNKNGKILMPDRTMLNPPNNLRATTTSTIPNLREKIIQRARRYKEMDYLWAGRGHRGIDCSGLVQMAYGSVGIFLPRDADQQHLLGRISATSDWREDLAPADLLFFTGPMGNITHVALSIGGRDFIHAKGGARVASGSLDSKHESYEESLDRSFYMAKRLIR